MNKMWYNNKLLKGGGLMNKKINLYLNIIESVLIFILVGLGVLFYTHNIQLNGLQRNLIITTSFILEFIAVSIELFMFYIMNNKFRGIAVIFYLLELLVPVMINTKIPFVGIALVMKLNIMKNFFRVYKFNLILEKENLYQFCDTFGIKIEKEKTKRKYTRKATTTTKAKAVSKTKPKTKTAPSKKTRKSYA
jgi:hypothetical protein